MKIVLRLITLMDWAFIVVFPLACYGAVCGLLALAGWVLAWALKGG
jgi:hypothetical protein